MAASKFNSSEDLSDCMTFLNSYSSRYADVQIHCLDIDIDDIIYWKEKSEYFLGVQFADDIHSCLQSIEFDRLDRIFLIVSEQFASEILAEVEQIPQVISVFIFCKNPTWKDMNVTLYKKYCGTFDNKDNLLEEVNYDIFQKTSLHSSKNVFRNKKIRQELFLDPNDLFSFSLLCDINDAARPLLENDYMSCDKQQMFRECRLLFSDNQEKLKQIDKLSERYNPNESIIYYTETGFLYKLINKVIRTQSSEIINKFRFFIKDFEDMLDLVFTKQIFNQWSSFSESTMQLRIVYRGQLLSSSDLTKLKSFIGKNMIISQYISTSKNIYQAQIFAGAGERSPKLESVLFHIDISIIYERYTDKPDPSIYYYDISHISKNPDEEEVLLRIGTTFKVLNTEYLSDNRWHVYLRVERVNDYRSKNKINQTPKEIVQSFFQKASKQQKIDVEDIINKHLSSDILIKISIYIRLGHLVKHHPREQLFYYQYALSQIPSNESKLLQIGYWAIRIRCIFSVNDWRIIPLNIYRQTVIHLQGNLKKKLHHELARIEVARSNFHAAKFHYNKLLKYTHNFSEQQIISDEMKEIEDKNDQLNPVFQLDEVPYRYLYAAILTTGERAIIDYHCKMFYQSIDTFSLTENFSFTDILPDDELYEHYQLLDEFFNNIKLDFTDLSIKHIFIISLIDKPFILKVQKNLTIGQLEEKIRSHLEGPSSFQYDFRLIHMGITLIDNKKLISDYQINDQSIIYLIYGPSSKNQPVNLDKKFQENTGLTNNVLKHLCLVEESRLEKLQSQLQRHVFNSLYRSRNIGQNQSTNSEIANNRLNQFFEDHLRLSQYDEDDDDADPADLLNLQNSIANQYFENSGPQTSASQLNDLISRHPYQLNVPINDIQSSGGFRVAALGTIAPTPKQFSPYVPAEKAQKWVDITSDRRQIPLFDPDRTHSSSDRIPSKKSWIRH